MFLIQEVLFIANIKALSHQKVYNLNEIIKPQAEGKVNSRLYSRTQKKLTLFSNKNNNNEAIVSLSKVIFAY